MTVAFKASAEHDVGELGSALEGLREHNERLETQKRLLLAQVRGEEGEEGRTGQESCGCWRRYDRVSPFTGSGFRAVTQGQGLKKTSQRGGLEEAGSKAIFPLSSSHTSAIPL